jgi:hypothetical protein
MSGSAKYYGPYRRKRVAKIDRRTASGKLLDQFRRDLLDHIGGNSSAVERAIIERCCWLQLKCSLIDARIAAGTDTEYDSKSYLAWSSALRRALRDLGLKSADAKSPSLAEVLKAERIA